MPLAPLPSPSHLPGEGDSVGALVFLGSIFGIGNDAETHSIGTTASAKSPSPGRWEGDGRGDRGEVSGGGAVMTNPAPRTAPESHPAPHPGAPPPRASRSPRGGPPGPRSPSRGRGGGGG